MPTPRCDSVSGQVYGRERRLRQHLRILHGSALLLLVGLLFGLSVPLSKAAVSASSHPLGLTLWVNLLAASLCFATMLLRGQRPRLRRGDLSFILLWGLFGSALGEVLIFLVVEQLPAATVSIIVVCEGFLVFLVAGVLGQESPTWRRLAGLTVGAVGMLVLVRATEGEVDLQSSLFWLLLALGIPVAYAIEDLLLGCRWPTGLDRLMAIGMASSAGAAMLLPVTWWAGDFAALSLRPGLLEAVLGVLAIISVCGSILLVRLAQGMGAVFSSQAGYVITLAGVMWSMLLLDEQPSNTTWLALVLVLVALLLVEPKREAEGMPYRME